MVFGVKSILKSLLSPVYARAVRLPLVRAVVAREVGRLATEPYSAAIIDAFVQRDCGAAYGVSARDKMDLVAGFRNSNAHIQSGTSPLVHTILAQEILSIRPTSRATSSSAARGRGPVPRVYPWSADSRDAGCWYAIPSRACPMMARNSTMDSTPNATVAISKVCCRGGGGSAREHPAVRQSRRLHIHPRLLLRIPECAIRPHCLRLSRRRSREFDARLSPAHLAPTDRRRRAVLRRRGRPGSRGHILRRGMVAGDARLRRARLHRIRLRHPPQPNGILHRLHAQNSDASIPPVG